MADISLRVVDRPLPPGTMLSRVGRKFGLGIDDGFVLDPGDMWREPEHDMTGQPMVRECWAIVLPNGRVWRTTDPASDPPHPLWDVTGQPPGITVSPSINDTSPRGGWHGWIQDGKLRNA